MLDILFISDYVCPYCLVGKEALKIALKELGLEAEIAWHPYELTEEPAERVDTYHDDVRKEKYNVLYKPCEELGLDMKLPPNVIPRPYTRLAFEGWYFACNHGRGEEYNDLMYRAYFIDEKDIGDLEVLIALAESIGLDGPAFKEALESGKYSKREKEDVAYAKNVLQVRGLPSIYVNEKKLTLKEYTIEEMKKNLLNQNTEESANGGAFCGIDGCHF